MTSSVIIHPEQLRGARESMAMSLEEVASVLGVSVSHLIKWEDGSEEPDLDELEALARFYGRSVDFFLLERPESPKNVFFRTQHYSLQSQLSVETRRILVSFEELCRFEWELEGFSGISNPIGFVQHKNGFTPDDLAYWERKDLELESKPIKDLRSLLARVGIRVFLLEVPGNEFSGLSWWHSLYGPAVLINGTENAGRRNFTMAHEFGHLLTASLSEMTLCDLSDIDSERSANRFAVAFLMPQDDLTDFWLSEVKNKQEVDIELLSRISRRYGVSLEALAIRLEELRLLPTARWLIESSPKPKSFGRRRPNWRRSRGERYFRKALVAYAKRNISLGKLAEYLGTDLRSAKQAAEEV